MPTIADADTIRVGTAAASAVYAGTVKVWPTFAPSLLTGLSVWFDATTIGLADGALVASWPDLSGHGLHLVANTPANRPTFRTGVRNGQPVVRFNGSGPFMQQSVAYTTAGHLFIVATWTGGSAFPDYNGLLTGTSALVFLGTAGATVWYPFDAGAAYHYNGVPNAARKAPFGEWAVMGLSYPPTYTSFATVVGLDRGSYPPRYWWGDIAEVVIYDHKLTDPERVQVETYLGAKWAIP